MDGDEGGSAVWCNWEGFDVIEQFCETMMRGKVRTGY